MNVPEWVVAVNLTACGLALVGPVVVVRFAEYRFAPWLGRLILLSTAGFMAQLAWWGWSRWQEWYDYPAVPIGGGCALWLVWIGLLGDDEHVIGWMREFITHLRGPRAEDFVPDTERAGEPVRRQPRTK